MIVKTLKLDADHPLELNLMSISSGRYSGTCIDRIEFLTDEEDYVIEARKYGKFDQQYLHTYTDATQIAHNLLTAYRDGMTCLSISSTATGWLQVWHRIISPRPYAETYADAFHRKIRERKTLKHNLQYYRKQRDDIYIDQSICDYKPEPGSFGELLEKELAEEGLPSIVYRSTPVPGDDTIPRTGDIVSGIVVESEGECLLDIICGFPKKNCYPTTTISPGIHSYNLVIPVTCLVYEHCWVKFSQPNKILSASVTTLSIPDLRDSMIRGLTVHVTVGDGYLYKKGVLANS